MELAALLKRAPGSVQNGSVNAVREWKAAHAACLKVANGTRTSTVELRSAIARMREFR